MAGPERRSLLWWVVSLSDGASRRGGRRGTHQGLDDLDVEFMRGQLDLASGIDASVPFLESCGIKVLGLAAVESAYGWQGPLAPQSPEARWMARWRLRPMEAMGLFEVVDAIQFRKPKDVAAVGYGIYSSSHALHTFTPECRGRLQACETHGGLGLTARDHIAQWVAQGRVLADAAHRDALLTAVHLPSPVAALLTAGFGGAHSLGRHTQDWSGDECTSYLDGAARRRGC